MITLHILELLKQEGFGTAIDTDLHWERLPLDGYGVTIFSRGGEQAYGRNHITQRFDLYARFADGLVAYDKLDKIRMYLSESYGELCELPTITGKSNRVYKNVRFTVLDNIENIGTDESDKLIFRLAGQIIYEREN